MCVCVQENAHFVVVDMVLEVLEGVKWNLSADDVRRRPDRGHMQESGHQPKTFSVLSTDSGFEGKTKNGRMTPCGFESG